MMVILQTTVYPYNGYIANNCLSIQPAVNLQNELIITAQFIHITCPKSS
jgi:hypothetical protein